MLLLIETSAEFPSVVLSSGKGKQDWTRESFEKQSHAECIPVFINEAFEFVKENNEEIQAVVINQGPGSYTGLRIGSSIVKGICYGSGIPLIAVSGLTAQGNWALKNNLHLNKAYSMLDARRNEVYFSEVNLNDADSNVKSLILGENEFEIHPNSIIVGNSNTKAVELISELGICERFDTTLHAKFMIDIAWSKYQNRDFEDVAYFEPKYAKDFVPGISKKFSV